MKPFTLSPGTLNYAQLQAIFNDEVTLSLDDNAKPGIAASVATVDAVVDSGKTVYGINTGFGQLANKTIAPDQLLRLQTNIVLSHACGTGELLDDGTVRLILALKINNLAQGFSGARLSLIEALITLFNAKVYPCIPEKGSVGASGDLVPLAHMALILLGVGDARFQGKIISASEGLTHAGLTPIALAPKEGLALLNGMQVSNAMALKAYFLAERFFNTAILSGSLTVEAALASDKPFDPRIHAVRGHAGQIQAAALYRQVLEDSEIRQSHHQCDRVQDPYSLRCQPQVMGACLHQLDFVRDTLLVEANAVSDNPLVFSEDQQIISGGNFHGEILAMAADNMALAIAEIGALSERRIALLIDANLSQLPPFLVKEGGLNSGFMLAHVTAASAASDNKALAHPHSVDSLPTSANQEDHVSMATNGARRLMPMLDNVATILAIELLAACQGIEFRRPLKSSQRLEQVYAVIRHHVPAYVCDRYFAPDIAVIKALVHTNQLVDLM